MFQSSTLIQFCFTLTSALGVTCRVYCGQVKNLNPPIPEGSREGFGFRVCVLFV